MMLNQPPPELFPERPVRSEYGRSGFGQGLPYRLRRVLTLLVLGVVIGGSLYLWLSRSTPTVPSDVPTIRAEGSYKQRPEKPGGLEIPHQDIDVYKALEGGVAKDTSFAVEHIMPPSEVPEPQASSSGTLPMPPTSQISAISSSVPSTTIPGGAQTPSQGSGGISKDAPNPALASRADTSQAVPRVETLLSSEPISVGESPVQATPTPLNPIPQNLSLEGASSQGAFSQGPTSQGQTPQNTDSLSSDSQNKVHEASAPLVRSGLRADLPAPASPAVASSLSEGLQEQVPTGNLEDKLKDPAKPLAKPKALPLPESTSLHQVLENVTAKTKTGPVVQLAATSDPASAQKLVKHLETKYDSILKGVSLRVERADLGSKGVFFRVQGVVTTQGQALKICSELKKLNAGCFVVR